MLEIAGEEDAPDGSLLYWKRPLCVLINNPTEEKTQAIQEAPMPTNVTDLRSFLGIVTKKLVRGKKWSAQTTFGTPKVVRTYQNQS
jgi:hypothetical protein